MDLFCCVLFNEDVGGSDYISSDDRMIKELERIWKEAVLSFVWNGWRKQRKTSVSVSGS